MKYWIEQYKGAKDWNSKQTGGNLKQSVHYNEIDEVLGCRDAVTLNRVGEAGAVIRLERKRPPLKILSAQTTLNKELQGRKRRKGQGKMTSRTRNGSSLKMLSQGWKHNEVK